MHPPPSATPTGITPTKADLSSAQITYSTIPYDVKRMEPPALWSNRPIQRLHPTHIILHINQACSTLLLVSDASVQNNKQSGFTWILVNKNQPLWRGVGLVRRHKDDMYLERAEAFGLIASLTFLKYYIDCYGHK